MRTAIAIAVVIASAACNKATPSTNDTSATASSPSSTSSLPAPSAPAASGASPSGSRATDTFATSKGDLKVTPLNHATLLFEFAGKSIYLDPTKDADYSGLPKADYVFLTDIHADHLDPAGLERVKTASTMVVGPKAVADKTAVGTVLANGEKKPFGAFEVEGVPMYNLTRGPEAGKLFHDKGRGDGFVFTFGDKRVYVSGDTECTPEMKALQNIDVAFVCMNLPYTMPPAEAAACIKAFRPKVLFPYHYRNSNLDELTTALAGEKGIEVRTRKWY